MKKRSFSLGGLVKGPNFGWNMFLVIVLIAEFIIFGMKNSKFLRVSLLLNASNDFLPICFISIFVTFVMITGGIDIQAGSIVGLTSIVIGILWQELGLNVWAAVVLAVIVAGCCGALSGFFVAYCRVQAMVVTLGGSFLYSGLALLVASLSSTEMYKGLSIESESFRAFTKTKLFGVVPLQIILFLVMLLIAYILLHRSKYGRKIYLVGVNPSAAEYSGVNSRAVIMSTYILSGIAAGITGVFMTSQFSNTALPSHGSTLTMSIITACVLGGTLSTGGKGSVIGTALAAIIIGLVRFGMPLCFNINKQYLDIPIRLLLVVVVVGRAVASNPAVIAKVGKLRKKDAAGAR